MDQTSLDVSYKDFPNICRSCSNRGTLKPLQALEYINLYQLLIESKVSEDDGLPYQMCSACIDKLEDIQVFAIVCKNNEGYLRRILSEAKSIQCQNDLIQIENEEPGPPSPRNSDEDEGNEESLLEDITSRTTKPSYSRKAQPSNCDVCQTSFKTKKALVTHQLKNPSCKVKNHKCTSCNKTFFTKSKLLIHIRTHTSDTPFECKDCFKRFRHQSSLKRHVEVVHEGLKPFKCEICGKDFATLQRVTEHTHIHTGERPYSCKYCGLTFKKHSTKHAHEIRHRVKNGELPPSCGPTKRYPRKPPKDPSELECSLCSKKFTTKQAAKLHQRIHLGEKSFLCNVCGKGFLRKNHLEVHSRIHTGERPYECTACGKRFRQPGCYRDHMSIHEGVRKHQCDVCKRNFVQIGHLQSHMKTHTGEKPFKCSFCDKAFAHNGNLKVHFRIHTGERSYQCDICSIGFYDSNGLKKHKKTHNCIEDNVVS
ncbi:unnamed protein product [Callosobruchus maculatus]|uniref:Protein krueppel n=2 Tax=Callosobruchus maculatus TaxID=64391 RepID=A0A653C1A2_CALMS|nr:unnamed protein product [Callosobruchus maculatus]